MSQNKFDLDEVVSFQSQLANFSRAVGSVDPNAPDMNPTLAGVEELVLVKAY